MPGNHEALFDLHSQPDKVDCLMRNRGMPCRGGRRLRADEDLQDQGFA